MQKRYPFKFLDSYSKQDKDIFFGRDEEVEALYQMTFQSNILLVYGASGTGKTSLINAGLASRFQAHDWKALTIRRGNNLNDALSAKLEEAIGGDSNATEFNFSWLDEEEESNTTKSSLSRQLENIYSEYFRPIYLIFDQFEELYILGDQEEQEQFVENVKDILKVEHPVKLIFVIREEYLGNLFEFERAVPQLLRKKLRVEPMNLDKVGQVIHNSTTLPGSIIKLQKEQEDQIVEGIFQKIRDENSLTIRLPYLQVFLDKLYLHITGDENRQADAILTVQALREIGDIGDVLRDFLEKQAIRIQKSLRLQYNNIPEDTIWQILSPLATLEGTKEPMLEQELLQKVSHLPEEVIKAALKALDESRILRYDEDDGRYEVAHDSLAARIAEHRNDDDIAILEIGRLISNQMALKVEAREYFTEKQLNLIAPFVTKLGLDEEALNWIEQSRQAIATKKVEEEQQAKANANRKRLQRFLVVMGLFSIIMIALAGWAFDQRQKARKAVEELRNSQEKTQKALDDLRASQERTVQLAKEVGVTSVLTEIAIKLESKKLVYSSELLQDNSGIVHQILDLMTDSFPNRSVLQPDLSKFRSSRQIADWYYQQGKLNIIEDPIASRNLIRPGSVIFFGKSGKRYSNMDIDQLTDRKNNHSSTGIIAHVAIVTAVKNNENGDVAEYTMMHARNPRSFASRTGSKEVQSVSNQSLPPFGNWNQQWVAIAYPFESENEE